MKKSRVWEVIFESQISEILAVLSAFLQVRKSNYVNFFLCSEEKVVLTRRFNIKDIFIRKSICIVFQLQEWVKMFCIYYYILSFYEEKSWHYLEKRY